MIDDVVMLLVSLWRELLGDDVDADSNFFVHGGHSLLGITLLARVEDTTGVNLQLVDLFRCPTPSRLAERLRAAA
jgi:hypothetical protein